MAEKASGKRGDEKNAEGEKGFKKKKEKKTHQVNHSALASVALRLLLLRTPAPLKDATQESAVVRE